MKTRKELTPLNSIFFISFHFGNYPFPFISLSSRFLNEYTPTITTFILVLSLQQLSDKDKHAFEIIDWTYSYFCKTIQIVTPVIWGVKQQKKHRKVPVEAFVKYWLIIVNVCNSDVDRHDGRERLGRAQILGLYENSKASVLIFIDVVL